MTHSDIYTKYMIEYDKAMITSSYPSITKYEAATILDKAYLALIAQKVTGNNPRQTPFEADVKAIEDIRPLIKTKKTVVDSYTPDNEVTNAFSCKLPKDMLYYVSATTKQYRVPAVPDRDYPRQRISNVRLVDHNTATKFFATTTNMPWIKEPIAYIEGDTITVVYDLYESMKHDAIPSELNITYIHTPNKFVTENPSNLFSAESEFELNDTMAEELINLAIIMAGEIVESPRTTTKTQLRPLES